MSKRLAICLTVLAALLGATRAPAQTVPASTPFTYPVVPDTITSFNDRAEYFVTHFWDRADMNRVFANRKALRSALSDYFQLMPHARAEVALTSIDKLLGSLKKKPAELEFVALSAQDMLYGDSASFWSDELFLPFAEAAAANKKVSAGTRLRLERIASALKGTKRGSKAPELTLTKADGSLAAIYEPDDSVAYQILFFNDPECDECADARRRLDADFLCSRLIGAGLLKVTSIYPGEADEEFRSRIAPRYPSTWLVGANEEADAVYDLRTQPCFYLLTGQGFIVEKNIGLDDVLGILYRLRNLQIPPSE